MITGRFDLSRFGHLRDETLKQLQGGVVESVQGGLDTAVSYARAHHQHTRRTGYLTSDAIHGDIESVGPTGVTGAFHNDAPYAGFVEYGTQPHRIYPRNGGVLAFEVGTPTVHGFATGTETVFAKYVDHPGTSPMPFMHPAAIVGLNDTRRRLIENLRAVADLWK